MVYKRTRSGKSYDSRDAMQDVIYGAMQAATPYIGQSMRHGANWLFNNQVNNSPLGRQIRGRSAMRGPRDFGRRTQSTPARTSQLTPSSRPLTLRRGRQYTISGRYSGKARYSKKKSKKVNLSMKKVTIEERIEDGGVQTATECCGVGVTSTPTKRVLSQIVACVYAQLFKQSGKYIPNWDAVNALAYNFGMDGTNVNTGAIVGFNTAGGAATATHLQIVDNLVTQIELQDQNVVYNKAYLNLTIGTAVESSNEVQLASFGVQLDHYATISVQNRTLAASALAPDTADEDNTNVSNNPVKGVIYVTNNQVLMPKNQTPGYNYADMRPDPARGYLSTTFTNAQYAKPQKPSFYYNCTSAGKLYLAPGHIKKCTVKWKKYHLFNYWMSLYKRTLFDSSQLQRPAPIGQTVFLCVEKLLDTRTDVRDIEIGFETNLTLKAKYMYKRKEYTNPFVTVGASPV